MTSTITPALRLETARLRLIACPAAIVRALDGGIVGVESVLGARIDPQWFDADGRDILSFYAYQLRTDPGVIGWGVWLLLLRDAGVIIGSAGFKGHPDWRGRIEIGYGITPRYRRRGYTYEAVCALIDWGFDRPSVRRIIARCAADNTGSRRILEKVGMRPHTNGVVRGYLRWTLSRADWSRARPVITANDDDTLADRRQL